MTDNQRIYQRYGMTILVALLISIYTMTSASKFHIVDEVSLFAVTESVALRGDVDTNTIAWTQWVNSPGEVLGAFGTDGQVYSKKGPAPAIFAAPWYLLLRTLARLNIHFGLLQGTLLWNGLVTALTAALLWLTALRLGYDNHTGALLGLLFGLGTIAWPYANHFFGEPLSALALLTTFYSIHLWRADQRLRWLFLAGTGAAVTVATVTAHLPLIALLGLYLLVLPWLGESVPAKIGREARDNPLLAGFPPLGSGQPGGRFKTLRAPLAFALPIVVSGVLLLFYNYTRFGDPLDTGYHFDSGEGFTTPLLQGLWGLVLSPYRGLFWHTPLFIVSLLAFPIFWVRHRLVGTLIAGMSVLLLGLYSMWWMWWGGFAWGPRFLVPLTPFWVLLLAPFAAQFSQVLQQLWGRQFDHRWQQVLPAVGIGGWLLLLFIPVTIAVQLLAVSINYVNYEIRLRTLFPTDWADPLKFGPPVQSLTEFFYSPVFGQWELLREGFAANTDLAWFWATGNIQWLIVLVALAVLGTLVFTFVHWWRTDEDEEATVGGPIVSPVALWLLPLLPAILIAVWVGEVAYNPHYGDPARGYRGTLDALCQEVMPNDLVVTVAPYAYQIPMNWMAGQCPVDVPIYGYATDSMTHVEAQQALRETLVQNSRVWFITGGLPPNDPENSVERWLSTVAYKAEDVWYDDFRLLRYATPTKLANAPSVLFNINLGDDFDNHVVLIRTRAPMTARPGEVLPIELSYWLDVPPVSNLRWFVQLLSADGYPLALLDTEPEDGYAPFTTLPLNQELVERAGLQLPLNAPTGTYTLIAGLYNPAVEGAPRLRAPDGRDFVQLGTIAVE